MYMACETKSGSFQAAKRGKLPERNVPMSSTPPGGKSSKREEKVKDLNTGQRSGEKVLILAGCLAHLSIFNGNIWLRLPDNARDPRRKQDILTFCEKLRKEYRQHYIQVGIGNTLCDYEGSQLKEQEDFFGFADNPRTWYKLRSEGYNEVITA